MRKFLPTLAILLTFISTTTLASAAKFDYDKFITAYYQAMVNTQKPSASSEDLEHYLSFLTDNVGNQHLPNAPDDSRTPEGKKLYQLV